MYGFFFFDGFEYYRFLSSCFSYPLFFTLHTESEQERYGTNEGQKK